MSSPRQDLTSLSMAHRRGLAMVLAAVVVGLALVVWLGGWIGPSPSSYAQVFTTTSGPGGGAPRPRQGLVLTTENRGQVLFGRYCDSCHTAGREVLGSSLRSAQFKREFNTTVKISDFVRKGGFDMPALSKNFLSDADLDDIAKYVLSLPQEGR